MILQVRPWRQRGLTDRVTPAVTVTENLVKICSVASATSAFTTIQAAITAAAPGSSIRICPGTYAEDVNVNKPGLKLLVVNVGTTTIEGPYSGGASTLTISASNVLIDGLTITRQGNNPGQWAANPKSYGVIFSAPGRVWFVYYHFAPLANAPGGPPSDLFKVNFTVVGSPGMVSPVTIADLMVMEYGVPASVVPGSVTVLAPTSASLSVGGRVADASGRPIRGARVVLADAQGGTRTALSGPFGYYQIDGVSAGQTYAVEA